MTTGMDLTILGASASSPDAGDACAGYLIREGNTELLIDCGSGVISKLREHTCIERLSAIVISHFHPDHFIDLITLRYGLRYGLNDVVRPRLILPPGGIEYLTRVGIALRGQEAYFSKSYEMEEFDPEAELVVGDLTLTFQRTTHDIPTWAMAIRGRTSRLVYTADTQESSALESFAAGADVVLCESTYPASAGELPSGNHLTSTQAGQLAHAAGAGRLVLTHFWPGIDRSLFGREAEQVFDGPVVLANSGLRVEI
jgi:ribonuclease BN (tRNA processing enzyme)